MGRAGFEQVTMVELCWWQVDGGSSPFDKGLSLARVSALSSALGMAWVAFDGGMAMPCPFDPELPRVARKPPAPAAIRTRATRPATQGHQPGLRVGGRGGPGVRSSRPGPPTATGGPAGSCCLNTSEGELAPYRGRIAPTVSLRPGAAAMPPRAARASSTNSRQLA